MKVAADEVERRMKRFEETCEQRSLRRTPQRMAVFRELAESDEHPTAETLFGKIRERMPNVSRDTLYRTLWLLRDAQLISTVGALNEGMRFDANMEPHHHFVCVNCGCVRDFESAELDDYEPPARVKRWGTIREVQAEVRGVCRDCEEKT